MALGRPRLDAVAPRDDAEDRAFKTQPSPARLELEMTLGYKKCVHLQLKADTHVELRRIMVERGLSMQAVFEEFAQRVVVGDDYTENVIAAVIARRHQQALESMTRIDTDALLSAIDSTPAQVTPTVGKEEDVR